MGIIGSVRRHRLRWAFGSVAAVAALAVGGPYAYIHYVQGPAPAPLALSAASAEGAEPPAVAVDLTGTWTVAAPSEAGYRVEETLAGQSNTAVGRTSDVTGELAIADGTVTAATFTVDLTTLSSDQDARDGFVQGSILETDSFPTATFTLDEPIDLGGTPAAGDVVRETVTGALDVHGVARPVTVTIEAQRLDDTLEVTGSIPITFADHGVTAPNLSAASSVEDHGLVEFLLTFTRSDQA